MMDMISLDKAKQYVMVAIANTMGEGKISEEDARALVAKTNSELESLVAKATE